VVLGLRSFVAVSGLVQPLRVILTALSLFTDGIEVWHCLTDPNDPNDIYVSTHEDIAAKQPSASSGVDKGVATGVFIIPGPRYAN
jgi:hypothetical protein